MTSSQAHTTKKLADFRPLRAWRYSPAKVSMSDVIAPPYDIISPQKQIQLYNKSIYNCIRLILNKQETLDNEKNNPYTRAKHFFQDWKKQNILVQEHSPSYYLYEQIFHDPETFGVKTRRAILGRLKLEPFDKGIVIPHEKTLSKAREDRKRLLETTHTNFSPIFGLYEDEQGEIQKLIETCLEHAPLFEAEDEEGIRHVVWAISDPVQTERLHQAVLAKKIYIADGHHRYQVSLDHSIRQREAQGNPKGELLSDFTMMALVEFNDTGLILMPTHRMISDFQGYDEAKALTEIKKYFDVSVIDESELLEKLKDHPQPSEEKSKPQPIQYGLYFSSKKSYWLTLKDFSKVTAYMPPGRGHAWYKLDVAVLSHFVLRELYSLEESLWESTIRYSHSQHEAIERVKKGEFRAAFLLKAPHVEVLREMGKAGELMPQKSTYFWPKLASGLIFYSHEE